MVQSEYSTLSKTEGCLKSSSPRYNSLIGHFPFHLFWLFRPKLLGCYSKEKMKMRESFTTRVWWSLQASLEQEPFAVLSWDEEISRSLLKSSISKSQWLLPGSVFLDTVSFASNYERLN